MEIIDSPSECIFPLILKTAENAVNFLLCSLPGKLEMTLNHTYVKSIFFEFLDGIKPGLRRKPLRFPMLFNPRPEKLIISVLGNQLQGLIGIFGMKGKCIDLQNNKFRFSCLGISLLFIKQGALSLPASKSRGSVNGRQFTTPGLR